MVAQTNPQLVIYYKYEEFVLLTRNLNGQSVLPIKISGMFVHVAVNMLSHNFRLVICLFIIIQYL